MISNFLITDIQFSLIFVSMSIISWFLNRLYLSNIARHSEWYLFNSWSEWELYEVPLVPELWKISGYRMSCIILLEPQWYVSDIIIQIDILVVSCFRVSDISVISDENTLMRINNHGTVSWSPGGIYKTSCEADVTYYPLDTQTCRLILFRVNE